MSRSGPQEPPVRQAGTGRPRARGTRRASGGVPSEDPGLPDWARREADLTAAETGEAQDDGERGRWLRAQRPPHWG